LPAQDFPFLFVTDFTVLEEDSLFWLDRVEDQGNKAELTALISRVKSQRTKDPSVLFVPLPAVKLPFFVTVLQQDDMEASVLKDRAKQAEVVDKFVVRSRMISRSGSSRLYKPLVGCVWKISIGNGTAKTTTGTKVAKTEPRSFSSFFFRQMLPDMLAQQPINPALSKHPVPVFRTKQVQLLALSRKPAFILLFSGTDDDTKRFFVWKLSKVAGKRRVHHERLVFRLEARLVWKG
jgi:hypothetical protein